MSEDNIKIDIFLKTCNNTFKGLEKHYSKLGENGEHWAVKYRIKKGHFGKVWGLTPEDAIKNYQDLTKEV